MGKKVIDLTGQTFGRLTVLGRVRSDKRGYARFQCRCLCGNETIKSGRNLRDGYTRSCGCLYIEAQALLHEQRSKREVTPSGLRYHYENRGLSAYDLAKLYEVSPSTIYRWLASSEITVRTSSTAARMRMKKYPENHAAAVKASLASHKASGYQNLVLARQSSKNDNYRRLKKALILEMKKRSAKGTVETVCNYCDKRFRAWKSSSSKFCNWDCYSKHRKRESLNRLALQGKLPARADSTPQWLHDQLAESPTLMEQMNEKRPRAS